MNQAGGAGVRARLTRTLLIVASAFAVYANATTDIAPEYNRMVHWGLMGSVALLAFGRRDAASSPVARLLDTSLAALLAASTVFLILDYPSYILRTGLVTTAELVFGLIMIVLVLEATRRTVGWSLVLLVLAALAYAMGGQYLGGTFAHRGYDLTRLVSALYLGSTGIYGLPMEISATFVIMFVIFGELLSRSGGDRWFMDMALGLTGRLRGGAAMSAVGGSALMGMVSGSPVGCVVTVGNFTIPLMQKSGFGREFSGATVAVAATASMFTPPLMGAGAFLIAEFLQVPYRDVAKAAILPAALFYASLIVTVYLWARHLRLEPGGGQDRPRLGATLRAYGHMIPPVVVLLVLIYQGRSLMQAAFWSIVLTLACATLRRHTRVGLPRLLVSLEQAARGVVPIAVACAAAGIIEAVINLTGMGFTLSDVLIGMSGGQSFVLLALVMAAALLLGLALPPTAVYLILAGLTVPAMVLAGFEPMAAHFFVFFYSSLGAITPPVALAAYAAAALSGADVDRTGWLGFRLGLGGYVVPFLCMYFSGVLLIGSVASIITGTLAATGVVILVSALVHLVNRSLDRTPGSPAPV